MVSQEGSLVSIIGLWNPRERIFSVSLRSYRLSSRMIFARWCVLHKNSLTEVDISEEEYLNSQYHPYPHLLIKDPTFIKGHIYCLQVGDGKGDIESSNKVDLKKLPRITVTLPYIISLNGQVALDADVESNEIPTWMTWLKKFKIGNDRKSIKLKSSGEKFKGSTTNLGKHPKLVINGFDLDDESVYCLLVRTSHGFGKSEDVAVDITHKPAVILSGPSVVRKGNKIHCQYRTLNDSSISTTEWQRKKVGNWSSFSANNRIEVDPISRKLTIKNADKDDSAYYRIILKRAGNNYFQQSNILSILVTDTETPESERKRNCHRLVELEEIATKVFRKQFDQAIQPMELTDHIIRHFSKIKTYRIKYPGKDRAVYSKDFDISQMYNILRNTGVISNPTNGWNKRPLDQHTEASDDMERIHLNRNVLVHCPTRRIDTTEFNNVALDLSVAIHRLSKGSLLEEVCRVICDINIPAKQRNPMRNLENITTESGIGLEPVIKTNREKTNMQCLITCEVFNKISQDIRVYRHACLRDGKTPDVTDMEKKCLEEMSKRIQCFTCANGYQILQNLFTLVKDLLKTYGVTKFTMSFPLKLKASFQCLEDCMNFHRDIQNGILKTTFENLIQSQSYTDVFGLTPNDVKIEMEGLYQTNFSSSDNPGDVTVEKRICIKVQNPTYSTLVGHLVQDFCTVFNTIAEKTMLSNLDKTIFEDSFSEDTHLVTSIMDEIRQNLAWAVGNQEDLAKRFISRIIKLGRKYSFPILRCKMGSILLILRFSSAAQYQSFQEVEMRGFVDRDISELLLQPEYIKMFGLSRGDIDVEIEQSREIVLPEQEDTSSGKDIGSTLIEVIYANIKERNVGHIFHKKTCSLPKVSQAFTDYLDKNISNDELVEVFFSEFDKDLYVGTENMTRNFDRFWLLKDENSPPPLMLGRRYIKETAIYFARTVRWIVYYGHFSLFRYLVERLKAAGIHDNYLFGDGDNEKTKLLILGCFSGSYEVVSLLLEYLPWHCINMLIPSDNMSGPEHGNYVDKAVISNRKDGIPLFIDFAHSDSGYHSPLSAAAQTSLPITQLLISKGADVNSRESYKSPMYIAALNGKLDVVRYLVQQKASVKRGSQCEYYDFSSETENTQKVCDAVIPPISAAAMNNHSEIVAFLHTESKTIDTDSIPYLSPLCLSITCAHYEALETLIRCGVQENAPTILSAACMAARRNNLNILKLLRRHGFDINGGKGFLSTPLYEAAYYGHMDVFEYLVEEGADPKLWCRFTQRTPLHAASANGHYEIAHKLLVEIRLPKDAICARDSNKKTAMELAKENQHGMIVELIKVSLEYKRPTSSPI